MKKITLTYKYDDKTILYITEHFAWEETSKEEADVFIIANKNKIPARSLSASDIGWMIMQEDLEKIEVENMPEAKVGKER